VFDATIANSPANRPIATAAGGGRRANELRKRCDDGLTLAACRNERLIKRLACARRSAIRGRLRKRGALPSSAARTLGITRG